MNFNASDIGPSQHNHDHSLSNELEQSLAASSDALHLDCFFNFDNPQAGAQVGHNHANHQLPWIIGSTSGRWPPQNVPPMGLHHDPYRDYRHAELQRQSLPSPQPVVPRLALGQPSSDHHDQFLPQWAPDQPQNLQLDEVIQTSFNAVWPREWPSHDQDFQIASNDNHIPGPVPNSGPSPLLGPGITAQPTVTPSQMSTAPQQGRSKHTAKTSTCTSSRRLKAKSGIEPEGGEMPVQNYMFVPSNSGDATLDFREEMKYSLFNESLLPTMPKIKIMVRTSWETAISRQPADLREWAENFRCSLEKGLVNIVDSMNISHLINRRIRVLYLTEDESRFLDVTLTINGRIITVLFGNPAIMAYIGYLLYDSRYQYHRYISSGSTEPSPDGVSTMTVEKLRPLFTMTGTLFRWALEERRTGTVIDSRSKYARAEEPIDLPLFEIQLQTLPSSGSGDSLADSVESESERRHQPSQLQGELPLAPQDVLLSPCVGG
ncbi:uncharacterized protein F5147DRAFT_778375 [Suillus discolor]|uniref:Uncharacterized protein n=1 Tax=Suillus discolor TaxID=1912936 RepID=A0A9P7EYM1_9AGAM|nr:uncharacterized protein F5147DRAFT_778375 [Suillus discolor]KAG2096323.1 hypothetical protein F5147DRAFT_778375 [Suillus discolor]